MAAEPMASHSRVRRRYQNSPIVEAVCEFQFRPGNKWDWTIPGLVYNQIKGEFPQKREEKAFEINLAVQGPAGKVQQMGQSLTKMQFIRKDGSAMVQVGPDLLAVNAYPPYLGWEGFQGLIQGQFENYRTIAQPVGFKRIGLRYINKIVFPTPEIETTDYLHYYPRVPDTLKQEHGPFRMRMFHVYDEERDMLNLQIGHSQPVDGHLAIALDLDYHLVKAERVELARGMEWVETAHERIEAMFEACITDRTRALFEATA